LLPACVLKAVLAEARNNFMATLDRYNLQQLLGNQASGLFANPRRLRISVKSEPASRG
jgi:DNA-binding IscR family transcriptional regulator